MYKVINKLGGESNYPYVEPQIGGNHTASFAVGKLSVYWVPPLSRQHHTGLLL